MEIIQNLVIEHGFLTVEELSKELDVSLMTIRRDLDRLSAKGVIERCYGGATYRAETSQEKEYALKKKRTPYHQTINRLQSDRPDPRWRYTVP
ncbi:MAG: DeoR family transcriptional regulator [Clostridiales bacterium]|nr:DeoR family transcriptional regulator [Clostridiales bacterium]